MGLDLGSMLGRFWFHLGVHLGFIVGSWQDVEEVGTKGGPKGAKGRPK